MTNSRCSATAPRTSSWAWHRAFFTALIVVLVSACQDTTTPTSLTPDFQVTGPEVSVVVLLDESFAGRGHAANRSRAAEMARGMGVTPTHTYGTALFGFAASVLPGRINALRRDPRVRSVQLDGMASASPLGTSPRFGASANGRGNGNGGGKGGGKPKPEPEDPCLSEPAQNGGWGLERVGGSADGTGRTVWIIDSGVEFANCDLNVDVGRSENFIFDYVTGKGKKAQPATADDRYGHGTAVAGIVAAIDNDIGAVGVAAGATVVPVRVLGTNGYGSWSTIAAGIDYVAANAAPGDVANVSLGGPTHYDFVDEAILTGASRGIVFAIAAGNQSVDAATREPAHVEHVNVYTVSAIDNADTFASFSNFGNPPIDFAAPGVDILVLDLGGGVRVGSGTSASAPFVAGILTLQGLVATDGFALGDPDEDPDPIAHR